jgi:hypothetical protein
MQFRTLGLFSKAAVKAMAETLNVTVRMPRTNRALFIAMPDGKSAFKVTKLASNVFQVDLGSG